MGWTVSLQSETTVVDERVRVDAYRLKDGKGKRVRVWKRHWVIIGTTLNNLWYYIQPTSVLCPPSRRSDHQHERRHRKSQRFLPVSETGSNRSRIAVIRHNLFLHPLQISNAWKWQGHTGYAETVCTARPRGTIAFS